MSLAYSLAKEEERGRLVPDDHVGDLGLDELALADGDPESFSGGDVGQRLLQAGPQHPAAARGDAQAPILHSTHRHPEAVPVGDEHHLDLGAGRPRLLQQSPAGQHLVIAMRRDHQHAIGPGQSVPGGRAMM